MKTGFALPYFALQPTNQLFLALPGLPLSCEGSPLRLLGGWLVLKSQNHFVGRCFHANYVS